MSAFANVRFEIRKWVGSRPTIYTPLVQLKLIGNRDQLASRNTQIVIEGFPRSGNSFACAAFRLANPQVTQIATHLHVPAHVLRAVQLRLPTMVLLRHPFDVLQSDRALRHEIRQRNGLHNSMDRGPSFGQMASSYVDFYRRLQSVRSRVVVANFDTVRHEYGRVIEEVNRRFERNFAIFDGTEESVRKTRLSCGYHALPNELRDSIKLRVAEDFEREREFIAPLLASAVAEYEAFCEFAV
jgi:hypothetical protein